MENNPNFYVSEKDIKMNNKFSLTEIKKRFQGWKIVYLILVVVVVLELVFGIKTLLSPVPKSSQPQVEKLQPIGGGKIFLDSPKTNLKVGEELPITIKVSTGGYSTSGTDLVFYFDPKVLETSSTAFVRGKIYTDYPLVNIDSKAGIVRISGVASTVARAFNGIGELGVINFKAKGKGTTTLRIGFTKGKTDDSNVISASINKDILEEVNNLKITVQ